MKTIENLSPIIFSALATNNFLDEIHFACLSLDFNSLKKIIIKYNLNNLKETKEFIIQAEKVCNLFQSNQNHTKLIKIEPFDTKCIFCNYTKMVKGYEVEYSKKEDNINIIYKGAFAINFEINNGNLMDFSWCNAFLSKMDMEKI